MMDKITILKCKDCRKDIQVLTSEDSKVVAVRCPECYESFQKRMKEHCGK